MIRNLREARLAWARFWLRFAGLDRMGRTAMWLASFHAPPHYDRFHLANLRDNKFFISMKACIRHKKLTLEHNVFIDDDVLIFQAHQGGPVAIKRSAKILRRSILQTGREGAIEIGSKVSVQPNCFISAYLSPICIGNNVQIAPNCGFFSYDHDYQVGKAIDEQPFRTKGGIKIGDDVWIGINCTILDGVTIGEGAIISAGSVVMKSIPEGAIASGVPARVISWRKDAA